MSSSLETSNTQFNAPQYALVVTYAVVELLLHLTEHFLRGVYLSLFLLTVSLSSRVLRWCVEFLSDIQEVRSQFLQLTARDASQCGVECVEPEDTAVVYESTKQLPK
jgi:hypothetical protein